jgi:hypothetical protein
MQLTFQAPVKFGEPDFTSLFVSLSTQVRSDALSAVGQLNWAQADADFLSSLEWYGIADVLDAQGNSIPDWNVTSVSGFDYTRSYASQVPGQPVPEPGVVSLMSAAALLVAMARRRATTRR